MPARHISASQPDPSRRELSSTFDASVSPPRPPVRRNLFSAHLSRRPASSQSSQPSNSLSFSQAQSPPLLRPPPQRTLSQPSPFASPPQLHPSFTSTYDPTISPNHPLSPKTREAVFPSGGIVAVHPATGRPILPNIPTLPRHLRLSDDEDEQEEDGEEAEAEAEAEDENAEDPDDAANLDAHGDADTDDEFRHARPPNVHPYNQAGHDPFASPPPSPPVPHTQSHPPPPQSSQHTGHYAHPTTTEQDASSYEKQRYDAHLEDMMARHRSRAYAHRHPKAQGGKLANGTEAADEEREELMGHLMGALRREVARADEDGWMFGQVQRGVQELEAEGVVMSGGMGMGAGASAGVAVGERYE